MLWLNYPFEKKLNSSGTILGMLILIISALALLGWSFAAVTSSAFFDWAGPPQSRNAILMGVLGLGVIFHLWGYRQLSSICGISTLLVGVIINVQRFIATYIQTDFIQPLVPEYPILVSASSCFMLAGILLILINRDIFTQRLFQVISIISSIIIALSSLALFGYISGLSNTYGWVQSVRMSLFSSTLFLAFSIAILSISWELLLKHHLKFSSMAISIPIGICFLTVSLAMWHAVRSQDKFYREQSIERESNFVVSNIHYYLEETAQDFIRMTKRWELRGNTPEHEWRADAETTLTHQSALLSLQWIDSTFTPKWVVQRKNVNIEQFLPPLPMEMLKSGANSRDFILYLTKTNSNSYAIWILNPIFVNNAFDGYIAGVVDIPLMIDEIFKESGTTLEEIEIRDLQGNLIYEKDKEIDFSHVLIQNFSQLRFHGLNWIVNAVFVDSSLSRISYLPPLTLTLGLLMSGLVLVAFYFAQKSQTKAKELEQSLNDLLQTQNRLVNQEKLASLGGLTAGIAHEIKNPLSFIHNFSQLSLSLIDEVKVELEKYNNNIPKQEYVELIDTMNTLHLNVKSIFDQGKRAQNTIARILEQSRGKPGVRTTTDLHSLIEEYITLSYHGMRSQNPNFVAKFEKRFDPKIEKIDIVAEDFSRVLLNLLNNSYYALIEKKKMGGETFNPEMIITTKHLGDRIEIIIHDNGTGISDYAREKIFIPFFTTKPVGYGTGLGLSISRDIIVEGHGGIIRCESKEGEYTDFIIQIPLDSNTPLKGAPRIQEEPAIF
jgi:signal transduction histidine kinase